MAENLKLAWHLNLFSRTKVNTGLTVLALDAVFEMKILNVEILTLKTPATRTADNFQKYFLCLFF